MWVLVFLVLQIHAYKHAYVTLLTSADMGYVLGAQVAAKSLKELDRNQTADFVCIVSNQLQRHELWRDIELRLVFSGFKIKFVDALSNPDERVIQRRWFLDSYTKLHVRETLFVFGLTFHRFGLSTSTKRLFIWIQTFWFSSRWSICFLEISLYWQQRRICFLLTNFSLESW
jgi:hypothetical protein